MKRLLLSLFLCLCASSGFATNYEIVVAADAIPSEVTAAKELQQFIEKASGEILPIKREQSSNPCILVGQSQAASQLLGGMDFASLKRDEIVLKSAGHDLVLLGERPRGSIYAVYEFLENYYGIRFYAPDETLIPSTQKSISEIINQVKPARYAPSIFYREPFYDVVQGNTAFAARTRCNGHFFGVLNEEWGGHLPIHGFCHTMDQFLPSSQFYDAHSEWYAERNGTRVKGYTQLCLTNPEMRKALLGVVLERLKNDPSIRIISVSQNDNQHYCQCSQCEEFVKKNGNQTDLLLDVVNYIAEAIEKDYPQVLVETLAYQYTRHIPGTIRPRNNVMIRLCSIECDFGRPLDSDSNRSFSDDVKQWSDVAPLLFVWNYVTDFSKYYLPQPNWANLARDIRFLNQHHVYGMFEQGSTGIPKVSDLPELRAWVISKLLWNPSLNEEELMKEFAEGYYKEAAPYILTYLNVMKEAIAAHPEVKLTCYQKGTAKWLKDDFLIKLWRNNEALREMTRNPNLDAIVKQRIEYAMLPLSFAVLERPDLFQKEPFKQVDPVALAKHCIEISQQSGMSRYSESGGMSGKEFLDQLLRSYSKVENEGPKPDFVGEQDWVEIWPASGSLGQLGNWTFKEGADAHAIVRMPNNHYEWAMQYSFIPMGAYDFYLEVRAAKGIEGKPALTAGAYNFGSRITEGNEIQSQAIAGEDFKYVKIGKVHLDGDSILWIAPCLNPEVENIWIKRLILVKE